MRRFSERQPLSTVTEINVTPLLDLAFVLLIIFMITTPLMENSLDLVVPTSGAAQTQVDPAKVHTVSMDRNGELKLDDQPCDMASLEAQLQALHAADAASAVVVRADKTLPVQKLVDIMDRVQRAGITRVGVLTHPEETAP